MTGNKKKKFTCILILICVIVLGGTLGCAVYLNDYYRADMECIEAFVSANSVDMQMNENGDLVFLPEDAKAGFIFYPGGKVEYKAYIPLMNELASKGILCILVEMPFNLAVLDMNAAEGICQQYSEVESWYIGGHSLGGSMAASYLEKSMEDYDGLILLGSYSTADLSELNLDVLSIYGSEDQVMNREKYDENKENLSEDFVEIILDGGCHAYFGMYGEQEGDGTATITNEDQIYAASDAIIEFINP